MCRGRRVYLAKVDFKVAKCIVILLVTRNPSQRVEKEATYILWCMYASA